MKDISAQFLKIWKGVKPLQKGIAVMILLFISGVLGVLVVKSFTPNYIPLSIPASEHSRVRAYLDSCGTPFKEHPKKGILVSEEKFEHIYADLAASGVMKEEQDKGFELFDSNTWIKGEKELQVLEMRALKGQLERDLAGYDQIKSARVILDMAPGRSFGGAHYQTKASVILTLMPEAHLTSTHLRAITYHLAGAVRGLEANMIAISDTTGKLYKALDPVGEEEYLSNSALAFEMHLEQKINALLTTFIGKDHYFSGVQALFDEGLEKPTSLSVSIAIDEAFAGHLAEIQNQIEVMAVGYEVPVTLSVTALPFAMKKGGRLEKKRKPNSYFTLGLTFVVVAMALTSLYPFARRYAKRRQEESLFKVMTRVDVDQLANSIQGEDPEMIALMLSYLEPRRAEEMLASFPEEMQETLLNQLSELEHESY